MGGGYDGTFSPCKVHSAAGVVREEMMRTMPAIDNHQKRLFLSACCHFFQSTLDPFRTAVPFWGQGT